MSINGLLKVSQLPSGFCDDHLGAQVVELLPEVLRLQVARDRIQLRAAFGYSDFRRSNKRTGAVVATFDLFDVGTFSSTFSIDFGS